jgi:MFS family permease
MADKKRLPRLVWLLSLVSFFADVSSEMIYPLLPLFLVGVLGATKFQLGAIEGGAVMVVAILSIASGARSDRHGRLPWIRWGYGLPVLGKAVIATATAWPWVLAGRWLDRVGKGLRGAPRDALITDAVGPDQRGMAFGLHRAFDTAGALTGVVLSAFLLWWLSESPRPGLAAQGALARSSEWAFRCILGIGAVLGLASLALTFLLREPTNLDGHSRKDADAPKEPDALSGADGPVADVPRARLPRSYWSSLVALALFSLANSSDAFLLLRCSDLGFSPWEVVIVYALYNVTYSALSYPAGAWSDAWGRRKLIAAGWGIYMIVYAGMAFLPAQHAWFLWILMTLYGLYMALTDGVGKALIADQAPPGLRGRAMGYFHASTGIATLLASVLAGIAWDRWGAWAAMALGSVFALLGLAALSLPKSR